MRDRIPPFRLQNVGPEEKQAYIGLQLVLQQAHLTAQAIGLPFCQGMQRQKLLSLLRWVAASGRPAPSRVWATVAGAPAPWSARCSGSTSRPPAVDVEELDRPGHALAPPGWQFFRCDVNQFLI